MAVTALAAFFLLHGLPLDRPDGDALPEEVRLEVPFLPQGRLLCGGASAAMVLRYWGARDVYAEDFEELVDESRGGISTGDLTAAIRERGWRAFALRGDARTLRLHLSQRRPLVALLRSASDSFHYVVVVGYAGGEVFLHDPSVGPSRARSFARLKESWSAADFWALVILPPESPRDTAVETRAPLSLQKTRSPCQPLLQEALDRAGDGRPVEEALARAAELCPDEGVVFRELAALRFLSKSWGEAADLARQAVELDPEDDHAHSLLAASLFLDGAREDALAVWNERGRPVLDRVELSGLSRTRQEVVYRYLGLIPGSPLELESLRRARRRAADLPTIPRARLSYEPLSGDRVMLAASLPERPLIEPLAPMLLRAVVDASAHRTARISLSSPAGGGERIEAGYRWWTGRPRVWMSLSSPGMLGLPGIAELTAFVERQSYELSGTGAIVEETWRGAQFSLTEWLRASTRAEMGVSFEREHSLGDWLAVRAALEQRLGTDAVSLRASAAHWFSFGPSPPFDRLELSVAGASESPRREASIRGRLGAQWVSENAPFAAWPGAGSEGARSFLLRGRRLLDETGVIRGESFGTALVHGSIEVERTVWRPGWLRLAVAAFLDGARVLEGPNGGSGWLASPGAGLRVEIFGRVVRLDGATSLDRGGFVLSGGWVESW